MTALVVLGVALTGAGIGGLAYCILEGLRVKREKPEPQVVRARLQKLVAINLGSVALAACGLMAVVLGVML
jgi:hypothetical protein